MRQHRRQSCLGLQLPDHNLPQASPENKSCWRVRREAGITDRIGAVHSMRDRGGHNKVIIDLSIAGGGLRCMDYPQPF